MKNNVQRYNEYMIYERSNTICTIQEQYGDHRMKRHHCF